MHFTHTTTGYARVIVRLDERSLLQVVIDDVDRKSAVRVADVLVDVASDDVTSDSASQLSAIVNSLECATGCQVMVSTRDAEIPVDVDDVQQARLLWRSGGRHF